MIDLRQISAKSLILILVLWLGTAVLLFQLGPYAELRAAAGDAGLPEEAAGYSLPELEASLEALGEDGRETYRGFQGLDLINAVLTAVFFSLCLRFCFQRLFSPGNPAQWLALLPAVVGAAEVVENLALLSLAGSFPTLPESLANLASLATRIKLGVSAVVLPGTLVALLATALKAIARRR
ncbi:MAG: hypothetical protein AAF604_23500 [Acidobacteriota bacterium]